jgi:hypothetical protein
LTKRDGAARAVDRDVLLAAVFPAGIPPKQNIIRAIDQWLDQAEQLTQMR